MFLCPLVSDLYQIAHLKRISAEESQPLLNTNYLVITLLKERYSERKLENCIFNNKYFYWYDLGIIIVHSIIHNIRVYHMSTHIFNLI